jgi:predicted RNA-binding Zn-ribbon protein involved in translation (DUF1610 family)
MNRYRVYTLREDAADGCEIIVPDADNPTEPTDAPNRGSCTRWDCERCRHLNPAHTYRCQECGNPNPELEW